MEERIMLCYERCGTCKKAKKWCEEKGLSFSARPIKEEHPTREELAAWQKKSGLPLKRFFNTSGTLYRELGLKDKLPSMTEEQMLDLLSSDGMLVKRPLMIDGDRVLVGFRPEEWESLLS